MVDINTTLFHHFFEVSVANAVPAVPADALEDYFTLKVAPFEVAHSLLLIPGLNPDTFNLYIS
jgi:hypothetical protein